MLRGRSAGQIQAPVSSTVSYILCVPGLDPKLIRRFSRMLQHAIDATLSGRSDQHSATPA